MWTSCWYYGNRFPSFRVAITEDSRTVRTVPVSIRFTKAEATGVVLAKVGNPQRDEPLETSREVCRIAEADRDLLTKLLLKPFKSLTGYCFHHHSSLGKNETYTCAKALFAKENALLEKGCEIAQRLYAKSNHPNIKSGDLCIAHLKNLTVDGKPTDALCILKSETVEPFLSISSHNGDLKITTEQGINPEKIDKGCLILNTFEKTGYYVLTFDRAGAHSRFWIREFLGVRLITDDTFLTNHYADLAVTFLQGEGQRDAGQGDVAAKTVAAKRAMNYFDTKDQFNMQEFEEEVLRKDPEMMAKFKEHKARFEEESGQPLKESFGITTTAISKAKKKVGGVMRFDTGVEVRLLPEFQESALERGFDEKRGMGFVKIFFHERPT